MILEQWLGKQDVLSMKIPSVLIRYLVLLVIIKVLHNIIKTEVPEQSR